jgi:hypothetical protein
MVVIKRLMSVPFRNTSHHGDSWHETLEVVLEQTSAAFDVIPRPLEENRVGALLTRMGDSHPSFPRKRESTSSRRRAVDSSGLCRAVGNHPDSVSGPQNALCEVRQLTRAE